MTKLGNFNFSSYLYWVFRTLRRHLFFSEARLNHYLQYMWFQNRTLKYYLVWNIFSHSIQCEFGRAIFLGIAEDKSRIFRLCHSLASRPTHRSELYKSCLIPGGPAVVQQRQQTLGWPRTADLQRHWVRCKEKAHNTDTSVKYVAALSVLVSDLQNQEAIHFT